MHEILASGMEDVGVQTLCQFNRKVGLERLFYQRVFRGIEVVDCPVLKKLKLTAMKMLRSSTVGTGRLWRNDAEQ